MESEIRDVLRLVLKILRDPVMIATIQFVAHDELAEERVISQIMKQLKLQ